jgi:hypothetical protein
VVLMNCVSAPYTEMDWAKADAWDHTFLGRLTDLRVSSNGA